jgi:hypothetical protein
VAKKEEASILYNWFQLLSLNFYTATSLFHSVVTLQTEGKSSDSDVKQKRNFLCLPLLFFFRSINTWQRVDEKNTIKTNEFRFLRANFIQRTSLVVLATPYTTPPAPL